MTGGDYLAVNSFRIAALLAMAVPYLAFQLTGALSLADTVGLAFAVAASTFCPLLVLGIWWRTHVDHRRRGRPASSAESPPAPRYW